MIVLIAFGVFIVIASFFFNVDRWILYVIPWFIICIIICGVRWDYVDLEDPKGASSFIRSYCETENEIKFASCYGSTLRENNFSPRSWHIPVGSNYLITYQKLEPILGIPLAVYWGNLWFFYLILNLFSLGKWRKEEEADENTQAVDSTISARSPSENTKAVDSTFSLPSLTSDSFLERIFALLPILSVLCLGAFLVEFIFLLQGKPTPLPTPSDIPKDILDNRLIGWMIIVFTFLVYSIAVLKHSSKKPLSLGIDYAKSVWLGLFILWMPFLFYTVTVGIPLEDMKGIYILTDAENTMAALMILILLRIIIAIIDWLVSGKSFFKIVNFFWCMIFLFFIPPWLDSLRVLLDKNYNTIYPEAAAFQLYSFIIMLVLGLIISSSQIVLNKRNKTK